MGNTNMSLKYTKMQANKDFSTFAETNVALITHTFTDCSISSSLFSMCSLRVVAMGSKDGYGRDAVICIFKENKYCFMIHESYGCICMVLFIDPGNQERKKFSGYASKFTLPSYLETMICLMRKLHLWIHSVP